MEYEGIRSGVREYRFRGTGVLNPGCKDIRVGTHFKDIGVVVPGR